MEKINKIYNLRTKLDSFITDDLEVNDVFETVGHNYFKEDIKETCVLYYICGYITRYFMKHINCTICLNGIISNYPIYL